MQALHAWFSAPKTFIARRIATNPNKKLINSIYRILTDRNKTFYKSINEFVDRTKTVLASPVIIGQESYLAKVRKGNMVSLPITHIQYTNGAYIK